MRDDTPKIDPIPHVSQPQVLAFKFLAFPPKLFLCELSPRSMRDISGAAFDQRGIVAFVSAASGLVLPADARRRRPRDFRAQGGRDFQPLPSDPHPEEAAMRPSRRMKARLGPHGSRRRCAPPHHERLVAPRPLRLLPRRESLFLTAQHVPLRKKRI